jgi:hypothetical protein
MDLSPISYDDVSERDLFAIDLPGLDDALPELRMPSRHFVCLLAADFCQATDAQISRLAVHLVNAGACYFLCWGPDCERAHDLVDDVLLAHEPCATEASVILTTWHTEDSLDDVLHYFLTTCWPAEAYFESARSSLAVTVHDETLARQVRAAFADPREFVARVCGGAA